MATFLRLGALLPLLALASATSDAVLRLPGEPVAAAASQREFDYFVLAFLWPGTLCVPTTQCCPQNGCCRSKPFTEFTIHGLWADYSDGSWPACCSGPDFDVTKISSLLPLLEKYWPSLSCSSSSLCHGGKGLFWAHEWEKHGTCSSSVTKDEYSYFSTVLDLYFKYNITGILNKAGFTATNAEKYLLGDIVSTIKEAVGTSPLFVCRLGSIEELRLCFSKDFKPRECIIGSSSEDVSSCPREISLPTYAPIAPEDVSSANNWLANDKTFRAFSQLMKSLWS